MTFGAASACRPRARRRTRDLQVRRPQRTAALHERQARHRRQEMRSWCPARSTSCRRRSRRAASAAAGALPARDAAPGADAPRAGSARSWRRSSPPSRQRSRRRSRIWPSRKPCAPAARRNYATRRRSGLRPFKDNVETHEKNIEALRRELSNLPLSESSALRRPGPARHGGRGARRRDLVVRYANPAAENLLRDRREEPASGSRSCRSSASATTSSARCARRRARTGTTRRRRSPIAAPGASRCRCPASSTRHRAAATARCWSELRPIEQQLRLAREERLVDRAAVEPRAAAQPRARDQESARRAARLGAAARARARPRPELREYTQVIIKEADRLQALMDRMLTPHRAPQLERARASTRCSERVRSLVQAEFRHRDRSATTTPASRTWSGDREQLIQAVLNIARNAAQARRRRTHRSSATRAAAPGHHPAAAPQAGIRIASDRRRAWACRRRSGTGSSIRWSPGGKAAPAWALARADVRPVPPGRRSSSTVPPGPHRIHASCCR